MAGEIASTIVGKNKDAPIETAGKWGKQRVADSKASVQNTKSSCTCL